MSIIINLLHPNQEDLIAFELGELSVTIGRSSKADVTLKDHLCSSKHLKVFNVGQKIYIKDLSSKNGTKINGQKIKIDSQIFLGDKIKVGKHLIYLDIESMTLQEIKQHTNPRAKKAQRGLTLPNLTRTTFNREGQENNSSIQESNKIIIGDLPSKTVVKKYKVKLRDK